jgi:hypothetical protein
MSYDFQKVGTITASEARQVITDYLKTNGVPASCYGFKSGELHLVVGTQTAKVNCKAKLTFYQLQHELDRLMKIIEEFKTARSKRNQVDLEDAIKAASP